MSRSRALLAIAFCLALFLPAASQAKVVTYWYQPHYMAKVEDASARLQFLSPHFAPGNEYGFPIPSTSTFTLNKVSESNLGLNLFFTESGVEQKSQGLLALTTVSVPFTKNVVTSIVYANIEFFEIRNITKDTSPTPWCVVPAVSRGSQNNILCVPTQKDAQEVVDALATLAVACGTTLRESSSMALRPMTEKELRKNPKMTGCQVEEVDLDGPAAQADIREGDILRTVNGEVCAIQTVHAAIAEATAKPEGGVLHAEILRKGNAMSFDLRFPHMEVNAAELRQQIASTAKQSAPLPAGPAGGAAPAPIPAGFHLGISVRAVTATDVTALGLPNAKGVVVTNVEKGGLAEQMQMQDSDVILAVNGSEIGDVDFFAQFVRSGAAKSFRVWRKGQALDLAVPQSM